MSKKVPIRQCLGCRKHIAKNELIRIVKSPNGEISPDFKGKKPGRGAYICNNPDCFKKIIKTNALARAFKTQIPEETVNQLQDKIINKEISENLNGS